MQIIKIVKEADFAYTVEELLTLYGWKWVHQRPARTDKGWRTALSGEPGFPDYFAVKDRRAIAIELKSDTGNLEPEQYFWLCALQEAGIDCYLWQPSDDIQDIAKVLKRESRCKGAETYGKDWVECPYGEVGDCERCSEGENYGIMDMLESLK